MGTVVVHSQTKITLNPSLYLLWSLWPPPDLEMLIIVWVPTNAPGVPVIGAPVLKMLTSAGPCSLRIGWLAICLNDSNSVDWLNFFILSACVINMLMVLHRLYSIFNQLYPKIFS